MPCPCLARPTQSAAFSSARPAALTLARWLSARGGRCRLPASLTTARRREPLGAPRPAVRGEAGAGGGGGGGGDADGGAGPGGRGGGGGGGGGSSPREPARGPHWWQWLAGGLLSYLGLLVGCGAAWDAYLSAVQPRLDTCTATVSVIIPALNEERIIAETVRHVRQDWQPAALEVLVVDGGSTDGTAEAARRAGATVIRSSGRGRGRQMNAGAAAAAGEVLLFLHADTRLEADAVAAVRSALSCPRTVLVGFRPLIEDQGRPMLFSTANNLLKTWYGPLLFRPASYVRGLRMMFGDQALTCRAADLRSVGGFRPELPFMEDAELCLALHGAGPAARAAVHPGRGRVRMLLHCPATTSGRRIAAWGELRANLVFARVSLMWLAGASPDALHAAYRQLYQDVR